MTIAEIVALVTRIEAECMVKANTPKADALDRLAWGSAADTCKRIRLSISALKDIPDPARLLGEPTPEQQFYLDEIERQSNAPVDLTKVVGGPN